MYRTGIDRTIIGSALFGADDFNSRYNELITNIRELSDFQLIHKRGSLAMARSQALNSGSAQFYIALKELPELDGRYSVFGKVIEGIDSGARSNLCPLP